MCGACERRGDVREEELGLGEVGELGDEDVCGDVDGVGDFGFGWL